MKLIIDCDPDNMEAAFALLREQSADWEARYTRVGWGWQFRLGDGWCFVRRIAEGLSLKQDRASALPRPATQGDE